MNVMSLFVATLCTKEFKKNSLNYIGMVKKGDKIGMAFAHLEPFIGGIVHVIQFINGSYEPPVL